MFWKKRAKREDDRVWATKALKFQGICDEISKQTDRNGLVLAIAHFERSLEELRNVLDARNLKYRVSNTGLTSLDLSNQGRSATKTILALSENVSASGQFDSVTSARESHSDGVRIIVAEHYPLPEKDEALLAFANQLPYDTIVGFHISLDEPLMHAVGADSIVGLLKKLGWDESQFIAHPMITSAITSAQKNIKKKAIGDQRVSSMEEWFTYNCPSLR